MCNVDCHLQAVCLFRSHRYSHQHSHRQLLPFDIWGSFLLSLLPFLQCFSSDHPASPSVRLPWLQLRAPKNAFGCRRLQKSRRVAFALLILFFFFFTSPLLALCVCVHFAIFVFVLFFAQLRVFRKNSCKKARVIADSPISACALRTISLRRCSAFPAFPHRQASPFSWSTVFFPAPRPALFDVYACGFSFDSLFAMLFRLLVLLLLVFS